MPDSLTCKTAIMFRYLYPKTKIVILKYSQIFNPYQTFIFRQLLILRIMKCSCLVLQHAISADQCLRWLNTVLAVFDYMSFAKSWQEKGCCPQAETWRVKSVLIKDFDWQVKIDVFVVSMATWTIEYNLKFSLFLSLHKTCSLDFPINLHTAHYN